ncbi:subtilisin-like protease SBT5.3 [Citrus sinensis]|nr:subtilisin-like protease SBT5.3 [Citrus sinensis]
MDVNNVFLIGELTKEVFMDQLEGFISAEKPNYVCIEVLYDTDYIFLSKVKYIRDLLSMVEMINCKDIDTFMSTWQKLQKEAQGNLGHYVEDATYYRSIVGGMQYLHLMEVLRYLKVTQDYGLKFIKDGDMRLTGFTDADWAGDLDDKKQLVPTVSTLVINDILCTEKLVIWCYNLSATELAHNPVFQSRTKHIEIDMHYVKNKVFAGELNIEYIPSKEQSYVVYLGAHSHGPELSSVDLNRVTQYHHEFLGSFLGSNENPEDAIFYSYTRHINGFAAKLDDAVAAEMARLWPESKSFSEEGFGPIPSKWKGICQNDKDSQFHCNRKLIGARYFNQEYVSSFYSPRDIYGHGTHTLSTAGGNFVAGASVFGFGKGTAKGGSPKARVAAYKVWWEGLGGCFDGDIIEAFDMAIHDGVDVLSVSLGSEKPSQFLEDGIAIGSFHAVQHGILVVCSAGNDGLVDGAVAYDPKKVNGKILVCLDGNSRRVDKGLQAVLAGAAGIVLVNLPEYGNDRMTEPHVLPASDINFNDSISLNSYITSIKHPVGFITRPTTEFGTKPAPFMAAFSSKGPNMITPEILKPDITAPGENIIAAYTEAESPTNLNEDKRRIPFNSILGTSMSCPHISGIAGLLKTLHHDWSPAAIQSAITTTATTLDNNKQQILNASFAEATTFSYGAGHVQPNLAMDPGLVYDLTVNDYLNFLCALGYNKNVISLFSTNCSYTCPKNAISLVNFNYPSITVPKLSGSITVTRRVKNVGSPGTYQARVKTPQGVSVTIAPKSLKFINVGEEKSFKVIIKAKNASVTKDYVFGELIWSDEKQHQVRSPIVVKAV